MNGAGSSIAAGSIYMNLELVGQGHKIAPSLPSLKNHRVTSTNQVPACVAFRSNGIHGCVSPLERVAGDITGSVYGCLLTSSPELAWVSSAAPVLVSYMPRSLLHCAQQSFSSSY